MKHSRAALSPAAVSWAVASSANYLKLRKNAEGQPCDITFIGYFKPNDVVQATNGIRMGKP